MLDIAGGVALGLVGGWWCAPLTGTSRPRRTSSVVVGGMAAVAAEIVLFEGRVAALMLFVGFVVAFCIHSTFRSWLADHLAHDRGVIL